MSRAATLSICSLVLTALGASAASAQSTCNRDCLRTMLEQYLVAVVANDPAAAPLVTGIRQTANAIVTVRVRVRNGELTEAEWYVAREHDPGLSGPRQAGRPPPNLHNPDYLAENPPPERVVPRRERADRDTLARIVDSYFDAITSHDRTVALAHAGCGRAENGTPAPGGAFLPPVGGGDLPAAGSVRDCLAGLENFNLSMVQARRVPVVDVEAQVVLSFGV
ncbi:MAG: hypothetical protein PVH89_06635 [Gammaproteobacteria bacterium]|jgi:hypothetical protein